MVENLHKRGDTWHAVKRVPRRYQPVEERKMVWISLHTNSLRVATEKAATVLAQLEEAWEAWLAGDTSDADRRLEAAKELAAIRGHRYLTAARVAELPREGLLRRVEAVPVRKGKPDPRKAAALLGGVEEPQITVSKALALY